MTYTSTGKQRKLDKERGDQANERWCQDPECYAIVEGIERRRRCPNCGLLVCGWCFNHVHGIGLR